MFVALVRGINLCLAEALGAIRAQQYLLAPDLKQSPAKFIGICCDLGDSMLITINLAF